ncbi:hypothetical protein ACFO4O_12125 [Glaciecola siphonariae]|uniref:PEP-CTERM protein-sorting domain-containing protein n=1 Tax=Glaciecola siphonariae TaxID=521012 RepID=A0ABV9LYK4_9ALTE
MKRTTITLAGLFASALFAASANAALLFQGSSFNTTEVPLTVAEARAAWEAELFSFDIDDLDNISGGSPITSAFGNVYSDTGNGSSITADSDRIRGSRGGAPLIQFDVVFPAPVNAVGFDVLDNDGGEMSLTLTDALTLEETTFNFTSVAGSGRTEFFGVIFAPTTFISSLRVGGTDPGGITRWDNFTTGVSQAAVDAVSAPGVFSLFGLALVAFGLRKMRK